MLKIYRLLTITLSSLLLTATISFAQNRKQNDADYLYRSEFVTGINFNTNGGLIGGFSFKYAKALTPKMYHSFSIEAVNIKHPKERKFQNITTGSTFVPGKQNFLYAVRPQYGREFVLFKKAREQGIQVNFITAIGPSIAVIAPYLIEVPAGANTKIEQFDPEKHTNFQDILGTGSFMESLVKSNFQLGGSLKLATSFEFGTFSTNVTGFEAGIMLDYYRKEVVIIPFSENRNLYSSIYLTFFFGVRK